MGRSPTRPSGRSGALTAMLTYPSYILDANLRPIPGSMALVWGNNAAWVCQGCRELIGNRTGDSEYLVTCRCGNEYQIHRGTNVNGTANLAGAIGVQLLDAGTISARLGAGLAGRRRTSRIKVPMLLAPRPYPPLDQTTSPG